MNEILKKIAEEPDALEENLLLANDYIEGLNSQLEETKGATSQLAEQVEALKATNQRLFLRVTSPMSDDGEPKEPELSPWEKAVDAAGFDHEKLLK